jgi:hypothetical protein
MTNILNQLTVPRVSQPECCHVTAGTMAFLWSRTDMLKEVWQFVQTVGAWHGAVIRPDARGLCLTLDGVVLGHLGWQGRIELPFGPQVRGHLLEEGMARPDRYRPDTGRLVFDIRDAADIDRAIWLFRFAYLIAGSSAAAKASESRLTGCVSPLEVFAVQTGCAEVLGHPRNA